MREFGSKAQNAFDAQRSAESWISTTNRITDRFEEAGLSDRRFIDVQEGKKKSIDHTKRWNSPDAVPGTNYGIYGGRQYGALDIDHWEALPEEIQSLIEENPTLTTSSPHGSGKRAHYHFKFEDDAGIGNLDEDWGSLRIENQYVIGPGSEVEHEKACTDCAQVGTDSYTISRDLPIAVLSEDNLDILRGLCESTESENSPLESYTITDDTDIDTDSLEIGKTALRDLKKDSPATFKTVMKFLQGGTGDFDTGGLTKNGRLDGNAHNHVGLSLTFCAVRKYTEYDRSRCIAIAATLWTHYCQKHRVTNEENARPRKWLTEGRGYRNTIRQYVLKTADLDEFETMVKYKGGDWWRRRSHEYSGKTYDVVREALREVTPDLITTLYCATPFLRMSKGKDPRNSESERDSGGPNADELHELYPGKWEVIERAREIDEEYNAKWTYENAFRRMCAEKGEVCHARIGNTHVYYPQEHPDPPEASYVKVNGEKRDPEPLPDYTEESHNSVERNSQDQECESESGNASREGVQNTRPPEVEVESRLLNRRNAPPEKCTSEAHRRVAP